MHKFAFLLIVVLGGAYGYISAVKNDNPYPIMADEQMSADQRALIAKGKAWRPSPVWLPAYLMATVPDKMVTPKPLPAALGGAANREPLHVVGYGLKSVNDGGYDCSAIERSKYRGASTAVGLFMGLAVAIVVGFAAGWVSLRRKPDEQ
ncbi:MAG: hypothetical protein JXL80_06275 [Planctomycetes bacterium]|nr:hypothetical protein [Planctomycetota bacterium]